MKNIVIILIMLFVNSFASNKESLMNDIKSLIQKEEYLAIAINKYILQTGEIPVKDGKFDFALLEKKNYIDSNFNKISPITNKEIVVNFDKDTNSAFIVSLIEKAENYKDEHKYLYEFYTNNNFRVNTLAATIEDDKTKKENLVKGTQIIYDTVQRDIVNVINDKEKIFLENKKCTTNEYFYELANEKLTYKYCRTNDKDANKPIKITVYQESPIILDEELGVADLKYIKANIGDVAFVKKGNDWLEYYFHGETVVQGQEGTWSETDKIKKELKEQSDENYEQKVASYIPNAKDFYIRQGGGCYLANGDIYCWGKNSFRQVGINRGQMDNNINPDYVNTPVMLKAQIDNIKIDNVSYDIKSKKWYNSPFRVKFEKIGMNRTNVCGITNIFEDKSKNLKSGGELYCNGTLSSNYYEEVSTSNDVAVDTPILKRNKFVNKNKTNNIKNTNAIYLKDIAMIEDVVALLSDDGKIYTTGKNYKGSLGVGRDDGFFQQNDPTLISGSTKFKKIFALRDARTFGAISEDNKFYMWGERGVGWINKPTAISDKDFNENKIFVNTAEFILGDNANAYYKTKESEGKTTIELISGNINPISVSYFKDDTGKEYMLYIDQGLKLNANSSFTQSSNLLKCKNSDETDCSKAESEKLFEDSLNFLNTSSLENNNTKTDFTNVSIYKLDHQVKEYYEGFEHEDYNGWNLKLNPYKDGNNYYMGRFGNESSSNNYLNKTFDFGIENAKKSITVKFDFIQVGTWAKNDCLKPYLNSTSSVSSNEKCMTSNTNATTHKLTTTGTLDALGKLKLGFSSNITSSSKFFGIDNIEFIIGGKSILKNTFEPQVEGWYINNSDNNNLTSINDNFTYVPNDGTKLLPATTYLGRLPINFSCNGSQTKACPSTVKPVVVSKTYSFPEYKNYEVEIEFDFYEIDTWDGERFEFWANNEILAVDHFVMNGQEFLKDSNITGVNLQENIRSETGYTGDQSYRYKLKSKFDSSGNLKLEFKTNLEFTDTTYANKWSKFDEGIDNESWGIDNVRIKIKEPNKKFVCAMTGLEQSSQMYCWGNVARSLPILNTSLYDMDKIESLNKLFFSQNQDINKQMSFDTYDTNKNGMLFLKYPTYISGFDYPFYFK